MILVRPLMERRAQMGDVLRSCVAGERVVLSNAASLVGTSAVTLPLGFLFWWVAAHRFRTEAVGVAAASTSAMLLLATVSILGLGTLLIGELPRRRHHAHSLVVSALTIGGFAGLVLGLVFALVAPVASAEFEPLSASPQAVLLFAAGVSLTTVTLVLDQAVIGLMRGGLQLGRNAVLAISKLGLLWAVATWTAWESPLAIYGVWVLGTALSIAFLGLVAASERVTPERWRPDWRLVATLRRAAWWHHGLNLGLQGPIFALPVLVTALFSAREGAYFYAAWMIAGLVFVAPLSLTTVLYAVGSAQPDQVRPTMRHTVGQSLVVAVAASGFLVISAPWILRLFGHEYASRATWTLRIVALAVFPLIARYHYVALARISGRLRRATLLVALTSMLEVTGAVVGGELAGLTGLSAGWLAVVCLEGLVMGLPVYRVLRPEGGRDSGPIRLAGEEGAT